MVIIKDNNMNIVYRIIFNKRKKSNIMPFMYIGSKSNASIVNGIIYDKNGNPYYGSSCYENYLKIVEEDDISVEVLEKFDEYVDALNYESSIQKKLDVVADPAYFNLGISTVNNFSDPRYATYKHVITEKTVRLPRDHPAVERGEYVGVSKGASLTEEQRKKIGRSGEKNPFYGKKHSEESRKKMSEAALGREVSDDRKEWFIENVAKEKKTKEHRKKIGRKNLIMLKNKETGECIRIHREDTINYDLDLWINPYKLSDKKAAIGSRWITDGSINKKIKKDDEIPDGWTYGRTYTGWNKNKGNDL